MPVKVAWNRFHIDKRAASLLSASDADGDDLLTTREVADWLGVSPQWLAIGRVKKYGLEFVRVSSRHLAYRRSAVRGGWSRGLIPPPASTQNEPTAGAICRSLSRCAYAPLSQRGNTQMTNETNQPDTEIVQQQKQQQAAEQQQQQTATADAGVESEAVTVEGPAATADAGVESPAATGDGEVAT